MRTAGRGLPNIFKAFIVDMHARAQVQGDEVVTIISQMVTRPKKTAFKTGIKLMQEAMQINATEIKTYF